MITVTDLIGNTDPEAWAHALLDGQERPTIDAVTAYFADALLTGAQSQRDQANEITRQIAYDAAGYGAAMAATAPEPPIALMRQGIDRILRDHGIPTPEETPVKPDTPASHADRPRANPDAVDGVELRLSTLGQNYITVDVTFNGHTYEDVQLEPGKPVRL